MTIEEVLEEYPLKIYEWKDKMPQDSPAALIDSGDRSAVFLSQPMKYTAAEIKVSLAHEEGHYMTGATHKMMSPLDLISQHEYKANSYAYKKLVPMDDLMEKVSSGVYNIYELSDLYDVPVQFLVDTVTYYIRHDQGFSDMVDKLRFEDKK